MSRSDLEQKIYRLLDDLGTTPEEIAAFLEGQGVTGVRRIPERCPVAVYLRRATGVRVSAGSRRIHIIVHAKGATPPSDLPRHAMGATPASSSGGPEPIEIATPSPIANFIWAFDGGAFRSLLTWP